MIIENEKEAQIEQLQIELEKLKSQNSVVESLVQVLTDTASKMAAAEKGKKYYDAELGKTIQDAIGKLNGLKLSADFSPIVALTNELVSQNKKIIDIFYRQQPEPMQPMISEMIKKQTELIEKFLSKPQTSEAKPEWIFDIVRNGVNGSIDRINAKTK